jgi:4-oxalocrotonate tautomerase
MPIITIQQSIGRTLEQKQILLAKITEAFEVAYNLPPESVTVFFNEYEEDGWGKGGRVSRIQEVADS